MKISYQQAEGTGLMVGDGCLINGQGDPPGTLSTHGIIDITAFVLVLAYAGSVLNLGYDREVMAILK
jgi:hypothetical protein